MLTDKIRTKKEAEQYMIELKTGFNRNGAPLLKK